MKFSKSMKILIKIIIIIGAYGFIVYKFSYNEDFINVFRDFKIYAPNKLYLLFFVLLLMFVNWTTEALKWKILVKRLESISLLTSLKAVLSGVTVSIFTPNRVGEFGGRIFVLKRKNRISAIFSTIAGSISQLLVTILMGISAIVLLYIFFPENIFFQFPDKYLSYSLLFLVSILFVYVYFNIPYFSNYLSKIRFLRKYEKYYKVLCLYNKRELFYILLLSIFRYLIFLIQFYFLFKYFNVDIGIFSAFLSVALIYLFMSFIPTITIVEIGIRGSTALFFAGMFSDNDLGIISASVFSAI